MQIRLRTLLLAVGVCAIALAAIRSGWLQPLALFPLGFIGGVASGMAFASAAMPTKPWGRVFGAMLGGWLGLAVAIVVLFAIESGYAILHLREYWIVVVIFVPAAIGGGVTCLCWEAFWLRTETFLPRSRKRVRP